MATTGGTNLRDDIMRLDETGNAHAHKIYLIIKRLQCDLLLQ